MKKELEELEKTTEIFTKFKSRITDEEKTDDISSLLEEWQENNKIKKKKNNTLLNEKFDENDEKTLELSDLELDKTINLDDELLVSSKISYEDIDKKIVEGMDTKKKQKRYGLILICISLLFLPILVTLFIIESHSSKIIEKDILIIFSGIALGFLSIGINFYLRNYKLKEEIIGKRLWFKLYVYFMVIYATLCVFIITFLYNDYFDFKNTFMEKLSSSEDYNYILSWFYNDSEIESFLNNKKISSSN